MATEIKNVTEDVVEVIENNDIQVSGPTVVPTSSKAGWFVLGGTLLTVLTATTICVVKKIKKNKEEKKLVLLEAIDDTETTDETENDED